MLRNMAGMSESELKTVRLQVMVSPSELEAIDDWAFANRIRSRGEAVRRLIEAGLKAPKDLEKEKDSRSAK